MSSNSSENNSHSANIIGEGTILEGTLKANSDIRIGGIIEGETNVKGKLIISSTGEIQGNIHATDADIGGKVEGEIRVTNKLIFRDSSLVEGDVYTKTLLVEEGARINGRFSMTDSRSGSGNTKMKRSNGFAGSINQSNRPASDSDKDKSPAKGADKQQPDF